MEGISLHSTGILPNNSTSSFWSNSNREGFSLPNTTTARELFMSAVATIQMSTFFIEPKGKRDCGQTTFDYIIVGAGSAGSVVANRMSEIKNASVLLVEAGESPPLLSIFPAYFALLPNTKWDWNFLSIPSEAQSCHKEKRMNLPQGKMLGGGSSFNWLCYVTCDPHDYDTWAEITNDDSWRYDNILPLFKLNEDLRDEKILNSPNGQYHGTGGNVGVTRHKSEIVDTYFEAYKEMGHDIVLDTDGRNRLGFSHLLLNIADGVRQSTAHSFLKPAENRTNLCILINTMATKVLFDSDKNAVGIETVNVYGKKQTYKARKEVIVSAGSLNSAKLLLLSGVGPKEHLQELGIPVIADLPVGQNLQDHAPVLHSYITGKSIIPNLPINPTEYPEPIFVGYATMNKSQAYPDYQVLGSILDDPLMYLLSVLTSSYNQSITDQFFKESVGRQILLQYVTNLDQKSRGSVRLKSTNPADDPLVDLGMYTNKDDLDNAVRFNRDVGRIINTKFFKKQNSKLLKAPCCEHLDPETEDYWYCHCKCLSSSFYHYVSTCAMNIVTNSKLQVYNTSRLRVVDASIMPRVPGGNTNVPTMMIGQKGSDMIKEDYTKLSDLN